MSSTQSAIGNYDFQNDMEDEDLSYPPIFPSKDSYSPSDTEPSFRFPNKTDSLNIPGSGSGGNKQPHPESAAPKKIPVVFRYAIGQHKTIKEVYLIGTFTSWKDKVPMAKSDGEFVTIVDLPEGEHQYKFVVDGKWEHDTNQAMIDDNFNGKNNIVTVKKSDFEVMDALAIDQIQQGAQKSLSNTDDLSKSPPGEYTDEIPTRGLNNILMDKPPYLPPQLLNIVLNKDTSLRCEPALLPEPNHVMLKHLYALSIRDGVMVLSSTFRYKHKFVTTCFYKPI